MSLENVLHTLTPHIGGLTCAGEGAPRRELRTFSKLRAFEAISNWLAKYYFDEDISKHWDITVQDHQRKPYAAGDVLPVHV
jgi:hypothetical protein